MQIPQIEASGNPTSREKIENGDGAEEERLYVVYKKGGVDARR